MTAPSRNSNASVRSRHCFQSERSADVDEITSTQRKHEIQIALLRRRAASTSSSAKPLARTEWLLAGIIDAASLGSCPSLDTMQTLTQQYQTTTTTLLPSPVVRSSLCSHQISNPLVHSRSGQVVSGWRWLSWEVSRISLPLLALSPFDFELENTLEDHAVSRQNTESYRRCFPAQRALSALQRFNRRRCAFLLRAILPLQLTRRLTVRSSPNFWT